MPSKTLFRFPDKPEKMSFSKLNKLKEGKYIATLKFDGVRCILDWDNGLYARSSTGNPLPIPDPIKDSLLPALQGLPHMQLDCELIQDRLAIFGIRRWNKEWIGHFPEHKRWEIVTSIPTIERHLPLYCRSQYTTLLNFAKHIKNVEGLVVKDVSSSLIGSTKTTAVNPRWYKVVFQPKGV